MKPRKRNKPPKVGDLQTSGGIQTQVLEVGETAGGNYIIKSSSEPLARKRGYRTRNEAVGFKIEFMPPPFVPGGMRRDPAKLTRKDWDFNALLESSDLRLKNLALFHELARESARMRETCRIYEEGKATSENWDAKEAEANHRVFEAQDKVAHISKEYEALKTAVESTKPKARELKALAAKKTELEEAQKLANNALCESSHIAVMACNGLERHNWNQAEEFLSARFRSFPYEVRGLLLHWIANDVPWSGIKAKEKDQLIADVKKSEAERKGQKTHRGLQCSDVPPVVPSWPFDSPIEFARQWDDKGRAQYVYGDGMPGLPCLTPKGNGSDAENILSESLELCVCLNYRDEEILEAFKAWLEQRRKNLHVDLERFRVSSKRPYTKLKRNNVDAALKGLAALRLLAAMKPLEAASEFDRVYFPNAKNRKPDIGNLHKAASIAIEWQQMFFKYCPLDSAGPVNPEKGKWDRECSLCFNLKQFTKEPKPMSAFHYPCRCSVCDHRETVCWNGKKWVPYDP